MEGYEYAIAEKNAAAKFSNGYGVDMKALLDGNMQAQNVGVTIRCL